MSEIPVIDHDAVLRSVSPEEAIERVAEGFAEHAAGRWQMPPKVYLDCPPNGDFRAMPASGGGVAIVKWVTSFPGNPKKGLPTVFGTIVASDAGDGRPLALIDGRAVTALRTGAAAAVATRALSPTGASSAGLIGCGLHGLWAARCLRAAGFAHGTCYDVDPTAAERVASDVGWNPGPLERALACDVVTTVTPGHEPVVTLEDLRPGTHFNALGADGPNKSEFDIEVLVRCSLFCDDWDQASHGGELHAAVDNGAVDRSRVTDLGHVLSGSAPGRATPKEITLFDSTGLAIQDLAIVRALLEALDSGALEAPRITV